MSLTPLTHDQFLHLHEAWRLFDTDCDGLVTPKDLQTLLRSFGYEHSLEELEVYLDDLPVCVEKDRCLDEPEFFLWALKLAETIEQEERSKKLQRELDLEDMEGLDAYQKLVRKEFLNTTKTNRIELDETENAVREADDRKVFDAVDQDSNGFVTYQDIEKLSREMGEKLSFSQLNTIMDSATRHGEMRRIPFDRFQKLCRQPVAWNELDMLQCHADLLEQQAEERLYQARRTGAAAQQEDSADEKNTDTKKSKKGGKLSAAKPSGGDSGGCGVM